MVTTYWQSLLRAKTGTAQDSNGFASAAGFLMAGGALLVSTRATVLSEPRSRPWVMILSLLCGGLLVTSMGLFAEVWAIYVAFVIFQVVFRLSSATCAQQVGAEVRRSGLATQQQLPPLLQHAQELQQQLSSTASPDDAVVGADALIVVGGLPSRARVALVFSIQEVLSAAVQSTLQFGFGHWRTEDGKLAPLAARFEALGIFLLAGGSALALYTTVRSVVGSRAAMRLGRDRDSHCRALA